ncbi:hypothetical protein VNI00_018051 [Paramarasmius palmivorus]|uniref:DUF6534 domain-containing protein n=1 Tax=Paramarasmius palmivorus TaxID=297713 RepID=A0AAW0B0K7_9AGAR
MVQMVTLHQAFVYHTFYKYIITSFSLGGILLDDIVWYVLLQCFAIQLIDPTRSATASVLVTALVALVVQAYFTWRVYMLNGQSITLAVVIISLLVLACFALTIVYFTRALRIESFSGLIVLKTLSRIINGLTATIDIAITAALCHRLRASRSGNERSDTVINEIVLYCVRTGVLTSLCAILSLIMVTVVPNTFAYMAIYSLLPHFYATSLFAS